MKKTHSISVLLFFVLCSFVYHSSSFDTTKPPKITKLKFGIITINGTEYVKDVVIEAGAIRQRKKKPSKSLREKYGHTPLTPMEQIPWDCEVLVIGKGMSSRLPITEEFKAAAKEHNVELVILQTPDAVKYFTKNYHKKMNAIFHITC